MTTDQAKQLLQIIIDLTRAAEEGPNQGMRLERVRSAAEKLRTELGSGQRPI
jgi:hypothetical protein